MLPHWAKSLPATATVLSVAGLGGTALLLVLSPMFPALGGSLGSPGAPTLPSGSPGTGHPGAPPPGTPAPPGGGHPFTSYVNGSPFLAVGQGSLGITTDDSLLAQQYATPGASQIEDSYLLQVSPMVSSGRAYLQLWQGSNYTSSFDVVSLGSVAPLAGGVYAQEGTSVLHGAAGTLAVVAAHDGSGNNVAPLLADPTSNATTPGSAYFNGTSGSTILAGFGSVANASQDVLLLRMQQEPAFPPGSPNGVAVEVQNPNTGTFSTVAVVAPREYWATFALPLAGSLPIGTQNVVVRLIWQGSHDLSWLALGDGVATLPPSADPLLSAISSQGVNVTSELLAKDNISATLAPGMYIDLTFGVGAGLPVGSQWVFTANGDPLTNGTGPHADFWFTPSAPVVGQSVSFTSISWDTTAPIVSQNWTFGDGGTASGGSPVHAYGTGGSFNATLTIRDSLGYVASEVQRVNVTVPLGSGPCGHGAFACYTANVSLAVDVQGRGHPQPNDTVSVQILLLNTSGCGGGGWSDAAAGASPSWGGCRCGWSDLAASPALPPAPLPAAALPDHGSCACPGGWGWADPLHHGGNVTCTTLLWLNATATSFGGWTWANGTLVVPWSGSSPPSLGDLFARVTVNASVGTVSWWLNFSTALFSQGIQGWAHGGWHHGGSGTWVYDLSWPLYWVLAGGLLVTFDSTPYLPPSGVLGVLWNFTSPSSSPPRCAVDNLTCALSQGPWGWGHPPSGFPSRLLDHATCSALHGTPYARLVCGTAWGVGAVHLFADPGSYTVTLTILRGTGSITVVRSVNAAVSW